MCGCPVLVLIRVITGAASVATFPRQVEYGVPAGKASTVVARSQAVRGWGTAGDRMSHIGVYSSWAPGSLALETS